MRMRVLNGYIKNIWEGDVSMDKNYDARNIALTILCRILENQVPSHIALSEGLADRQITKEDRSFIKKLVMGTIERVITIDEIINRYSSVKVKKQKPVIRNIIRIGIFQILFMDVPDSAACNESVKLAKKRKFMGLSGFVNGILRKITVEKEGIYTELSFDIAGDKEKCSNDIACKTENADLDEIARKTENSDLEKLSFKYSLPEWIVEYYIERFGLDKAEKAFAYFLKDSSVQIRCNISRIKPAELVEILKAEKVTVTQRNESEKCMMISGFDKLENLSSFKKGLFSVQDYSSVLAGECLSSGIIEEYLDNLRLKEISDPRSDNKSQVLEILDICAAPGGKTFNLADRLEAEGFNAHFTACDVSEDKLEKILENITRCGIKGIDRAVNDGTVYNPSFFERFDIVIADVPCSGLGVISRKPDIKLNSSPEKIRELAKLQRQILDNTVKYVKKGGFLLFSTCTIGKAENEDNVRYIEERGFNRINAVQICPGEYDCDGFFYSLLKKC